MSTGNWGLSASARTRRPGSPTGGSIRLDPARSSTSTARRWLRIALTGVVPDDVLEDATLVVSELVANSVEHTTSDEITLSVRIDRRGLVIEVQDQGPGLPIAWPMPGLHGRSRGLMMIGKLTSAVSSRTLPEGGAVVEAVVPLASGNVPRA